MSERSKIILPDPDINLIADEAIIARLNRLYEAPWVLDERNQIVSLNHYWWAGLIAQEDHYVHDQDLGFFYYDDNGIYAPISHYKVQTDVAFRLLYASRQMSYPPLAEKRGLPVVRHITEILRGITDKREPFFSREPVLALANGLIVFKGTKFTFQDFSPEFRFREKSVVPYVAGADCPRFKSEFMAAMLPDPDDQSLLQKQVGLMLIGQNPSHRMVILEGESAAGKTTLVNIIISLVGENAAMQLRTEHLEKQFELDALRGRSLLLGNDVGSKFLNTSGAQTLKGLVSNDLYHPEAKNRSDRRTLRGPFNVLIATNSKLTYRAQGDAPAWRRRLVIYYCQKPENRKRIPNFEAVLLKEEGPGIVNYFLEGAVAALKEVAGHGDLQLTPVQQDRVEKLILRSDPIETFIERCVVPDEAEDITAFELHEAYVGFCHAREWPVGSEEDFYKKVGGVIADKFGVSRSHSIMRQTGVKPKQVNGWRNLKLVDEGWRKAEGPF